MGAICLLEYLQVLIYGMAGFEYAQAGVRWCDSRRDGKRGAAPAARMQRAFRVCIGFGDSEGFPRTFWEEWRWRVVHS